MRWQIESCFRTMKTEFKTRPVYLRNGNRIEAHFLTCFLSLLILKIIQIKTKNEHSEEEILSTLRSMNVHKLRDLGYLGSYTRTEITDDLHESFGFRTDKEFISKKTMKKNIEKDEKSINNTTFLKTSKSLKRTVYNVFQSSFNCKVSNSRS